MESVKPVFLSEGTCNASSFKEKTYGKIPVTEDIITILQDNFDKYSLYIRINCRENKPEVIRWSIIGFPLEAK